MTKKKLDIRVWVPIYVPFQMGGNCEEIISTTAVAELAITLSMKGKIDAVLYRVTDPIGRVFYIEKETGGVMGMDLDVVVNDYYDADSHFLKKQTEKHRGMLDQSRPVPPREFWKHITKNTK